MIFVVFSLRTSLRNYFSADTGTKTAHDHISLISELCHLKRSFDIYELNAIRHYIYDTADNTRLVLQASLQANFAK